MLLYTRHYFYQLFCVNKASNRIFSSNCWRNSSTMFGGQCLQIQPHKNCGPFHCNFQFQELYQRYQFYSTGNDGIHPFPLDDSGNSSLPNEIGFSSLADDSSNSSSPNETEDSVNFSSANDKANSSPADDSSNSSPLLKIPTNIAMEQKGKHKIQRTTIPDDIILKDYVWLNKSNGTFLRLRLEKGKNGHKIFNIGSKFDNLNVSTDHYFSIPFPNDAYAFVRALDELILELATKHFDQKLLLQGKRQSKRLLKLRTVKMIGKFHKFQLELLFFPNENRTDIKPELCFLLLALPIENNSTKKRWFLFPLKALPWMREQMVDMLVRHDGKEQIVRDASAKIPNKYLL